MAFRVTKSSRGLVKPIEQTPTCTLELSPIDRSHILNFHVRTLHVYRQGPGAAKVLREGLAKVLVPYYPFAGRLKESSQGLLQLECSGQGAWFVEASADCTLQDVKYLEDDTAISYEDLFPDQVPMDNGAEPPMQFQVTQFSCGGFVLGMLLNHAIADGQGAAQLQNALGEMCRGHERLTITPVWHRDFISRPPRLQAVDTTPPSPHLKSKYRLKHADFDISLEKIELFKRKYKEATRQTCSTFEILAATMWRHRTLAINFKQDTEVRLVFFANCRQFLDTPLPKGFYGNCVFLVNVKASSEELAKASNFDVIRLIKEAKDRIGTEFGKYVKGDFEEDPYATPELYTTLLISDLSRLGLSSADYGWGLPLHVFPLHCSSSPLPVGLLGSMPGQKKGIRLMTWSVDEAHCETFTKLMEDLV